MANWRNMDIRDLVFFRIPLAAADLALTLCIFLSLRSIFDFADTADTVILKGRSTYFLIVSCLLAYALVPVRLTGPRHGLRTVFRDAFLQVFVTMLIFAATEYVLFVIFAGRFYLLLGVVSVVGVTLLHLIVVTAVTMTRRHGRKGVECVIVGSGENAARLYTELTEGYLYRNYKVLGFLVDDAADLPRGAKLLGRIGDTADFLANHHVEQLYCSLNPAVDSGVINPIIKECENSFVDFFYVPNMDGYLKRSLKFSELGSVTVVNLREEPLDNPVNAMLKRVFDIVVSALFLCTLFPFILLFVSIGTWISSPGPVFFKQKRTGYKGKAFTMYKFRSMRVNAEADKLQATQDDPRKTRFGNFLRKTSIDELPQFINVFLGDMSVIGPRPHMEYHTEVYTKLVDEYLVRHMVRPGLTGWAQVNGCRGETRNVEQMEARVQHDIWYIEHWSFYLDMKIFFMTIFQVFKGDTQAY